MSRVSFFNPMDRLQIEAMNQRQRRAQVIGSNLANAETPGFRALGYDFEEQLGSLADQHDGVEGMKITRPEHKQHHFTNAQGVVLPDVFVRPSESVGHDGNTVDIDQEMAAMSHNHILFRATTETISRKVGLLKYAIQGGR